MNELTSVPKPTTNILVSVIRAAFWVTFLLFLSTVFIWLAIHFWIVPRIGEMRPQLESHASKILGVPLKIGRIDARNNGLVPSFELTNVQLFDARGTVALRLPRVVVAMSPRALLNFGFEQLYIDRPELTLRRSTDGKLFVAGLDFGGTDASDGVAVDWFFSQFEFAIHGGSVVWIDEMRNAPPLELLDVNLVIRNTGRNHAFRLDVTPPSGWGARFSAMAQLQQPLFSARNGQWRNWDGQIFVQSSNVDVSQLTVYANLGVNVVQGNGAVRAWVRLSKGNLTAATVDLALNQVKLWFETGRQPLEMTSMRGRIDFQNTLKLFVVETKQLEFVTSEGVKWPGGNVRYSRQSGADSHDAQSELVADKLDISALAQFADRLPLGQPVHSALAALHPSGVIDRVKASWSGSISSPVKFAALGRVAGLSMAAQPATQGAATSGRLPEIGVPGFQNADIEFELNDSGGRGTVAMRDGEIEFPGVFEEPHVSFSKLNAAVQWKVDGQRMSVSVQNLKFSNHDAEGELQAEWRTKDGASGNERFPGILKLEGGLSRGDGKRVHRYLPLVLSSSLRNYVRDSVVAANLTQVTYKVAGNLFDLPFQDPKLGEFRINAKIQDGVYDFAPKSVQSAGSLPWPRLQQLSASFAYDRNSLYIKGVQARLGQGPELRVTRADAGFTDLRSGNLSVAAEGRGPAMELLDLINASPVATMTGGALGKSVASGLVDYKLRLNLPLTNLERATVQGNVVLANNELQVSPETPKLQRARGTIQFTDLGYSVIAGQARAWGGDMRIEGGMQTLVRAPTDVPTSRMLPPGTLRIQGTATAEGLRQAAEAGALSSLAKRATGSVSYTAQLGLRHGTVELLVNTNLQGMSLNLPAPFGKSAEAALPVRFEKTVMQDLKHSQSGGVPRIYDQLQFEAGRIAAATFVRDVTGPVPVVLRGGVKVGGPLSDMLHVPPEGVAGNFTMGRFDLDTWSKLVDELSGPEFSTGVAGTNADRVDLSTYFPSSLALQAHELLFSGRTLTGVVAGVTREGLNWRANLDAKELNGYGEYRPSSSSGAGRVFLRLSRLTLGPANEAEVEHFLDEQPTTIPALDVIVDEFELRGKKWGRIEIEAINRNVNATARDVASREWRLNKFNISTPQGQLTATGNWASIGQQSAAANAAAPPRVLAQRRRMALSFRLNVADAGELLARFGTKDVVRKGHGTMEGQLSWLGSPLLPDFPSMSGVFNVKIEGGQFLKADPGLAKLLGVLSLQSLPRRLTLDFKDVFSDGFAFDLFGGDVFIEQGIAKTNNLQMKGVNAVVFMDGRADISRETQDIKVVVIPEINAGTASVIATWINPAVGLGTFLAQLFLRRPLIEANTQEFRIDGGWADPHIVRVERKPDPMGTRPALKERMEVSQ